MVKIKNANNKDSAQKAGIVSKNDVKNKSYEISRDSAIGEILEKCPESAFIMMKYGLHCVGCRIALTETLEDGCKSHMLSDEDIDSLVEEINRENASK